MTAFLLAGGLSQGALAETDRLDALYARLAEATPETYTAIEEQIVEEWGKSGSPALDLLVRRGREALATGDSEAAVEHFTALVDHAPEYFEGYAGRAQAYFQSGLFGPALDDLRQVLVLEPRHFGAMAGLGVMLESMGMEADALDAYRAASMVHPQEPNIAASIERLEGSIDGVDI
ncbi:tetratricopeptide repeat protein [Aestuariibius sp. 2305UL40-4]|uniref:tetratricopeptide repeat protein n=1 Tax=Aestuariibius violaceus TaxID=3234132 RepID=UPI00345EE48D